MEEAGSLENPSLIESLAQSLHGHYVKERQAEGDTPETNSSLVDFDRLPEDLQESNRDQARTIPRKLRRIGYGVRRTPAGTGAQRLRLSPEEIEELAEIEHARWNWQRILQGWVYAPGDKNEERKTTPYLVPWADLEDEIREYDRQSSRLIPEVLEGAGYEAYLLG